ncbi:TPA: hypothetical protein ACGOY6_001325 [Streptococcus suis]
MKFEFTLPRNTKQKALNMVINSNDRNDKYVQAKMIKRIRRFAYWETLQHMDRERAPFSPSNPCEISITVYKPTNRRLDTPNLYPTVKAIIDGMTEAGLWVDDDDDVIRAITFRPGGMSGIKGQYKLIFEIVRVENE